MFNTRSTCLGVTMLGLVALTPMAFAQGQHSLGSHMQGQMGMGAKRSKDAIIATVEKVHRQDQYVTLQIKDGKTVHIKAPERVLAELRQGDRVQLYLEEIIDLEKPNAILALVQDVDEDDQYVTLKLWDGDESQRVELHAPERVLSTLDEGDGVQVSIRKLSRKSQRSQQ